MSDPFFHYTHTDDESDGSSFAFAGTESRRGYHVLERTNSFHPVYQASHPASSVPLELRRSVLPPNDWPVDTPIHTHRPATAAQFISSSFPVPSTLRAAPISLHGGNSPPHSGYCTNSGVNPLISEHASRTVAMPTLTRDAQYGSGLIDAHTCHYDLSLGFTDDNYMVEYPRAIASPFIAMPIVPTFFGAAASSHLDPIFPSDPTLRRSPRNPTTTFQYPSPSNSTPSLSPSASFNSESYSSPRSPSTDNHSLVVSPSDMSDRIQPQPIITTSFDHLYTFTVSLEAVEFPSIGGAGEVPFFQCRWKNCGIWITSDKEAVKHHLTRTHNVVLKGKSTDSACCEWVGCSSSLQRNGLVRHFHTHLGLKWLCSVCKGAYTRQDSVGFHARKEPRCNLAQAISHPSAVAYKARINGDNTVALTKILQP